MKKPLLMLLKLKRRKKRGELQKLAGEKGLAIVPVHHDRKAEAEDPIDGVLDQAWKSQFGDKGCDVLQYFARGNSTNIWIFGGPNGNYKEYLNIPYVRSMLD